MRRYWQWGRRRHPPRHAAEAARNVDEAVPSGEQHERPTGRGDDGESRHAPSPALKKKTVLQYVALQCWSVAFDSQLSD
jgi:hypothetical protein